MVIWREKCQRYYEVREVKSTRLSNGSDTRSKREIGFNVDAKGKRKKILLIEVGRKLEGFVWEDEILVWGMLSVKCQ